MITREELKQSGYREIYCSRDLNTTMGTFESPSKKYAIRVSLPDKYGAQSVTLILPKSEHSEPNTEPAIYLTLLRVTSITEVNKSLNWILLGSKAHLI